MEGILQKIPPEELDQIASYILETRLASAIEEFVRKNEIRMKELSLMERVIRVEEELKALREIEAARFEAIEKRFEAIDKRFEALQREMNARFEAQDKRFEAIDGRFEALQREMSARFEAQDKRFEALQREMNARFEAQDKRFEAMNKRFSFLQWFIGIGFSVLTILLTLFRFYPK